METKRNNQWLAQRLENVWQKHFPDVAIANTIVVRFGRQAKMRLGSIKYGRTKSNPTTYITITGFFRNEAVPEYVVDGVLAHELTHYTHGFFSPHPQLYRHPHQHRIVDTELTNRGFGDILKLQKAWLKAHWRSYLEHSRLDSQA